APAGGVGLAGDDSVSAPERRHTAAPAATGLNQTRQPVVGAAAGGADGVGMIDQVVVTDIQRGAVVQREIVDDADALGGAGGGRDDLARINGERRGDDVIDRQQAGAVLGQCSAAAVDVAEGDVVVVAV